MKLKYIWADSRYNRHMNRPVKENDNTFTSIKDDSIELKQLLEVLEKNKEIYKDEINKKEISDSITE